MLYSLLLEAALFSLQSFVFGVETLALPERQGLSKMHYIFSCHYQADVHNHKKWGKNIL